MAKKQNKIKINKLTVNSSLEILANLRVENGIGRVTDLEKELQSPRLAIQNGEVLADGLYRQVGSTWYKNEKQDPAEYPDAVNLTKMRQVCRISLAELLTALKKTRVYESTRDSQIVIQSTLLTIDGATTRARFVATDGYRLAVVFAPCQSCFPNATLPSLIIPAGTLNWLAEMTPGQNVTIYFKDDQLLFLGDNGEKLFVKMIAGKYPEWERIIPVKQPTIFMVDRKKLLTALDKLAPIAKLEINLVDLKIDLEKNSITLSARAADIPSVEIALSAVPSKMDPSIDRDTSVLMPIRHRVEDSQPNTISLNVRLLSEIVRGFAPSASVLFGTNGELAPVRLEGIAEGIGSEPGEVRPKVAEKENIELLEAGVMYCGKLCNKYKMTASYTYIFYAPATEPRKGSEGKKK